MRPSRIFRVGCCVLFIPFVSSTVLTATMLTSFMGGFLMGKMTLGTFLMMMQGLNNGQQAVVKNRESSPAAAASTVVAAATATPVPTLTAAAATQAEIDLRDKFLKQLGQMDPLNCLPKVFCELSSPNAAQALDDGVEDEEKVNDGSTENSDEDENSDSDETHDEQEGLDEEDDLNERLENRKKKQNLKLENDALDELVEESQDPADYYFILKDKMKLRPKYNRYTASHPPFFPKKPSNFLKKRGSANQYQDESEYKAVEEVKPKPSKNIDDIFADDPFFDDFARSMKFSPETVDYHRVGRQLRRIEEDTGDYRRKYRVAATVGEKSAQSCQYVFHTCPFKATQIMSMVNTIKKKNAGEYIYIQPAEATSQSTSQSTTTAPAETTNKVEKLTTVQQKKENLQNLKNTLLAIESLNNITLMAKTAGLPVSYNQILADVLENDDLDMTGVSAKILDDFDKESSNLTMTQTEEIDDTLPKSAERDIEITTKKSTKRRKTTERAKTKKNKNSRNKYRILRNRKRSGISKRSLSFRTGRSSSSEESFELPALEESPVILKLELPKSELRTATEEMEDTGEPFFDSHPSEPEDVGRIYFLKEEFDDDEAIASAEDDLFIPEFAKLSAYKKRPPQQRPQAPAPPRVQTYQHAGGNYNKRHRFSTTTESPIIRPSQNYPPGYNYNSESVLFGPNVRPQNHNNQGTTPPPRRKFSPPIEDDEADASESDRAVEKIIATRHKIKVRPFNYRTSKESLASSENSTSLT